jgi:hypothetical protein
MLKTRNIILSNAVDANSGARRGNFLPTRSKATALPPVGNRAETNDKNAQRLEESTFLDGG